MTNKNISSICGHLAANAATLMIAVVIILCIGCSDTANMKVTQQLAPPAIDADGNVIAAASEKSSDSAATSADAALPDGGNVHVIEAVALSVNGTPITATEIFMPVRNELKELAAKHSDRVKFTAEASRLISGEIANQIGQLLVVQAAESGLNEAESAWIDGEVERRMRQNILNAGGSRVKLQNELAAEGSDIETLKKSIRKDILSQLYMHRRVIMNLTFTRDEMLSYYNTHRDDYTTESMVQMRIMAFPYKAYDDSGNGDAAKSQALEAANAVKAKLAGGADFETLIREESPTTGYLRSNGGLWDMMPKGSFRESAVEEIAFSQGAGEISQPVIGKSGVFIVQTATVQEGKDLDFEQAQEDIEQKLKQQKYSLLAGQVFEKLRQGADIRHSKAFDIYALHLAMEIYYNKKAPASDTGQGS